jgi:hypothetical protein
VRQVPLIIEPDPDDPDFATVMVDATIAGRSRSLAAVAQQVLHFGKPCSLCRPAFASSAPAPHAVVEEPGNQQL